MRQDTKIKQPYSAEHIYTALMKNDIATIEQIIPKYCPPSITLFAGESPIFAALSYGSSLDIFKALIKLGVSVEISAEGRSPLNAAIADQRFDVAYELILAGATYTFEVLDRPF